MQNELPREVFHLQNLNFIIRYLYHYYQRMPATYISNQYYLAVSCFPIVNMYKTVLYIKTMEKYYRRCDQSSVSGHILSILVVFEGWRESSESLFRSIISFSESSHNMDVITTKPKTTESSSDAVNLPILAVLIGELKNCDAMARNPQRTNGYLTVIDQESCKVEVFLWESRISGFAQQNSTVYGPIYIDTINWQLRTVLCKNRVQSGVGFTINRLLYLVENISRKRSSKICFKYEIFLFRWISWIGWTPDWIVIR